MDVGRTDVTLDCIATGSILETSALVKVPSLVHKSEVGRPSTNPKTNQISSPITSRMFSPYDSQTPAGVESMFINQPEQMILRHSPAKKQILCLPRTKR